MSISHLLVCGAIFGCFIFISNDESDSIIETLELLQYRLMLPFYIPTLQIMAVQSMFCKIMQILPGLVLKILVYIDVGPCLCQQMGGYNRFFHSIRTSFLRVGAIFAVGNSKVISSFSRIGQFDLLGG